MTPCALSLSAHASLLDLETWVIVNSTFGTLSSRRRERGEESLGREAVGKEGKEKGRQRDEGKASGGGAAQCGLIRAPSRFTSVQAEHYPPLETAFLAHFSLGFLLFMMEPLVKETKIENKVYSTISRTFQY